MAEKDKKDQKATPESENLGPQTPLDGFSEENPSVTMDPDSEEQAGASEEKVPNVMFVGKTGEPLREIYGVQRMSLPDEETQRKGFFHENARELTIMFPKLYKSLVKKGG